jgi:amidase
MTEDDYAGCDAIDLAARVRSGQCRALDLVEAALARIARLDPTIGAIVTLDPEGARRAAAAVDTALPLAGVPILIKDTNLDVAGLPTRHGSRFYADARPAAADSTFVARLRRAGAIILGKSKTPEFASDFVTEPRWGGPARNPWNPAHATGGSSGGSAAAVAAFMVPVAHGTDCGGSIRVPAAACGLVGLKPTRGRTPQGPLVGERVGGLNVEGFLTRSVRDTAIFLDAVSGPEPGAPYGVPAPPGPWIDTLAAPLDRLRIGMTARAPTGGRVDSPIAEAVARTAEALRGQGHALIPWQWPDLAEAGEAAAVFWQAEIAELVEARIAELDRDPAEDELETVSLRAWTDTYARSALDYLAGRQIQNRVSRAMARAFEPIDLLLLPVTATPPPLIGAFAGGGYEYWADAAYGYAPFTEIFNMTGQPAISLPVALSEGGLPIGVQLAARFGEEALLLGVAARLEAGFGWTSRSPAFP